jgi:hypothetical protein
VKKSSRKLTLSRETLRSLTELENREVAGGLPTLNTCGNPCSIACSNWTCDTCRKPCTE